MPYIKNLGGQHLGLALVNASTGAALTGATVTARRVLDGGTQAAATGAVIEEGTGQYDFVPSAADINAVSASYLFTATGGMAVERTILTGNGLLQYNTTGQHIGFRLVSVTTGAVLTGATATAYRTIDGVRGAATGTVTEKGNGQYDFSTSAADTTGTSLSFLFTASGAVIVEKTLFTTGTASPSATNIGATIRAMALAVLQGVTFTGVTTIISRKLPKAGETLDFPLPIIILAPAARDRDREANSTEGTWGVTYPFEVCLVAGGNYDFGDSDTADLFQQQVRQAFAPCTYAAAPTVWLAEVEPGHLYDRGTLADNYNYTSMIVRFMSQESGG